MEEEFPFYVRQEQRKEVRDNTMSFWDIHMKKCDEEDIARLPEWKRRLSNESDFTYTNRAKRMGFLKDVMYVFSYNVQIGLRKRPKH